MTFLNLQQLHEQHVMRYGENVVVEEKGKLFLADEKGRITAASLEDPVFFYFDERLPDDEKGMTAKQVTPDMRTIRLSVRYPSLQEAWTTFHPMTGHITYDHSVEAICHTSQTDHFIHRGFSHQKLGTVPGKYDGTESKYTGRLNDMSELTNFLFSEELGVPGGVPSLSQIKPYIEKLPSSITAKGLDKNSLVSLVRQIPGPGRQVGYRFSYQHQSNFTALQSYLYTMNQILERTHW